MNGVTWIIDTDLLRTIKSSIFAVINLIKYLIIILSSFIKSDSIILRVLESHDVPIKPHIIQIVLGYFSITMILKLYEYHFAFLLNKYELNIPKITE